MAKMRGIKPETWTDERFVSVSPLARLLFIAMWTEACDNGHLDDSPVQLKIRLLPMDDCNVAELVDELVTIGLVERRDGYLKVRNLTQHQRIDKRYLSLCDHCEHDEHTTFTAADRPENQPRSGGARRAHAGRTAGARGGLAAEGEGEGEGEYLVPDSSETPEPQREDVEALCEHLAERITNNGNKPPAITKAWRTQARLLLDRDKRAPDEAHRLIDWCQDDQFWMGNILSMPKFREQYDKLRIRAGFAITKPATEPDRKPGFGEFGYTTPVMPGNEDEFDTFPEAGR